MKFLTAEAPTTAPNSITKAPTHLSFVILWRNILRDIESGPDVRGSIRRLVETMKDWPIVSVRLGANREKQLYASARTLPYLFAVTPSDDEDVAKAELILESFKLNEASNDLAIQSISSISDNGSNEGPTSGLDWSWTRRKFDQISKQYYSISENEIESVPNIAPATIRGEINDANIDPRAVIDDGSNNYDNISLGLSSAVSISTTDPLLPALEALNMPFIDNRLFVDPIKTISIATAENLSLFGTRLLHCVHFFQANNVVNSYVKSISGEVQIDSVERSLLDFNALSLDHRKTILLSIWNSHSHTNLTGREIDMLKELPLFLTNDGRPIRIIDHSDVYWCTSEAVLRGLYIPGVEDVSFSGNSGGTFTGLAAVFSSGPQATNHANQAVILRIDEELRDIYELVGAQKLTAAVAMRKFTLPALNRLTGKKRIQIIMDVASNWGSFRDDVALVELLKAVEFVPSWHYESYAVETGNESKDSFVETDSAPSIRSMSIEVEDFDLAMRRASNVYSWTNDALLDTLRGESMPRYFAPTSMRTPTMHAMMSDLGMMKEVDKEGLIR
jgi:hypothetical protein